MNLLNRYPSQKSADVGTTPSARNGEVSAGKSWLYHSSIEAGGDGAGASPSYALVHDWLPVYAGAERVLEQMLAVLPRAELFSLIDFLEPDQREFLAGRPVSTSFIQRMPFARKGYRYYLPLTPLAVEQFDLRDYDVVISSSYVVGKGVLTRPEQLHISYVHSPIRYAWDLHFDYLRDGNIEWGVRSIIARLILHYMRLYDVASASRVDVYAANSHHVARRIWKTYRRRAHVVYPPVNTDAFTLQTDKDDYYLTMSRLVPYKRIDLIVEAFNDMPDKELIVIGDGPEYARLASMAKRNVTMLGYQPMSTVQHYMQSAKAFVFAAEEDFGIVPVEAQACGTPVIAFGKGGILETVVPGETGFFFEAQTTASLQRAVEQFEEASPELAPESIRRHAEQFSHQNFRRAFGNLVAAEYEAHLEGGSGQHAW